ncbi:hypothetical protein AAHE18_05G050100 [Arachis hypogaea]
MSHSIITEQYNNNNNNNNNNDYTQITYYSFSLIYPRPLISDRIRQVIAHTEFHGHTYINGKKGAFRSFCFFPFSFLASLPVSSEGGVEWERVHCFAFLLNQLS